MLDSQSRHIRMFVCTKLQLHLIQWLRLNFELVRLSPKGKHRFPFVHRSQALLDRVVIWVGDHLDKISCAVLLGKSGWCKHQSWLPPLLQMLYVDWVSVDLNLTSRVFSGHSGFLPPQKSTPSKNRTPFKLALLNWTFLYKYWNI